MNLARKAAAIAAVLACLALAACQKAGELATEFGPGQSPADKAFAQVLDQYLVRGAIRQGPATEMLLNVLPGNWQVRQAWVERRAVSYDWTQAQKQKDLAAQRQEYQENIAILASVYVPERKWNDLDQANPNWRVFLINQKGQRLGPRDVRRIKKRTALHEAIYPFWGPWSRLYLVKFPWQDPQGQPFLSPQEREAVLLVTGPPGRVKLRLVVR